MTSMFSDDHGPDTHGAHRAAQAAFASLPEAPDRKPAFSDHDPILPAPKPGASVDVEDLP